MVQDITRQFHSTGEIVTKEDNSSWRVRRTTMFGDEDYECAVFQETAVPGIAVVYIHTPPFETRWYALGTALRGPFWVPGLSTGPDAKLVALDRAKSVRDRILQKTGKIFDTMAAVQEVRRERN